MKEHWRPCACNDCYAVSDKGRVRRRRIGVGTYPGKILRVVTTKRGYRWVSLSDGKGKGRAYFVHRLVAEAFIGPRPAGLQVNHKNGLKADNRAENLEYVTPSENLKHAFRTGLNRGKAKLTDEEVIQVRARFDAGETQVSLAAHYAISQAAVWAIGHRKTYRRIA